MAPMARATFANTVGPNELSFQPNYSHTPAAAPK